MRKEYSRREEKEYNRFRELFQRFVSTAIYATYCKIVFGLKVEGYRKELANKKYIVAGNHISAIDPFIMVHAIRRPIAFMAKKELFEKFFSRLYMDFLGAFAVDREKVEVSTIKTALSIKNTDWNLGFFPQGKRELKGQITQVNKGFASLAKTTKCDILPIAIIGADEKTRKPFRSKIKVKIGEFIPYSNDINDMIERWKNSIEKLTNEDIKIKEDVKT